MKKPPMSKISVALYILAFVFACGCTVALYQFVQSPGDTRQGTIAKIAALGAFRYSGIAALTAFVSGYVVQIVVDIRWKLFEGEKNA